MLLIYFATISFATFAQDKAKTLYFRKILVNSKNEIQGQFPIADSIANRSVCYHFTYDKKGRIQWIKYIRKHRMSLPDPCFGVPIVHIMYDEDNNVETRNFLDEKEHPIMNLNNIYYVRIKYDSNHFSIAQFNYNKHGFLSPDINGVYQYLWENDEQGRRIRSLRFDDKGQRITDNKGIYEVSYKYNEKNNLTEFSIYGTDGLLSENTLGYAIAKYKYDEQGNETELSFFGKDGILKSNINHYAIMRWTYDLNGNKIGEKYLDTNERLIENSDMYASTEWQYDASGTMIEEAHYGIYHQLREYNGAAVIKWGYNDDGIISETSYGTDGLPKKENENGIIKVR